MITCIVLLSTGLLPHQVGLPSSVYLVSIVFDLCLMLVCKPKRKSD